MKRFACSCLMGILSVTILFAQETGNKVQSQKSSQSEEKAKVAATDSEDLQQMNEDLQRMKVLLNQMRTNLSFVQTSQTPLKHQFELEADAWQIIVEQMDRRIQKMEKESRAGTEGSKLSIQTKLLPPR